MRKIAPLFLTLFTLLYVADAHATQTPELDPESQKDYVSDVFPYSLDFMREHILLEFDSGERAYYEDYNSAIYALPGGAKAIGDLAPKDYKKFIGFPLVRTNKFYVFYGAYPNMQSHLQSLTPYAVMGKSNVALQRYAALPADARTQDIYLWSPDAPYWYSQYMLNDIPVPFHSYFIVHLSAVDDDHTSVELIEEEPTVQLGRKMSVDANGLVHHFDIRDVEPTTSDREFLLSCMHQFIDRKLPSRHFFNCKTEEELEVERNTPAPTPFTVP